MVRNGGALGEARLLSPRMVELLITNQSGALHSTAGRGFSLAFQTTDRPGANGLEPVGAYGWAGAYGTVYRIDPQGGLVLSLMIQLIPNATDIQPKFQALVHQAVVP
jgi:CubicO group peptidase (beta-lactamase class C family)